MHDYYLTAGHHPTLIAVMEVLHKRNCSGWRSASAMCLEIQLIGVTDYQEWALNGELPILIIRRCDRLVLNRQRCKVLANPKSKAQAAYRRILSLLSFKATESQALTPNQA